jgi:hypothetical protein
MVAWWPEVSTRYCDIAGYIRHLAVFDVTDKIWNGEREV